MEKKDYALSRIQREKEVLLQHEVGIIVEQPSPLEMSIQHPTLGHIHIRFQKDHPFPPPAISLNGIPYNTWRRPASDRMARRYQEIYHDSPHDNNSILSNRKWSPAMALHRLLPLFRSDQERLQTVHKSLLLDAILEKNNMPAHLPILSFLV